MLIQFLQPERPKLDNIVAKRSSLNVGMSLQSARNLAKMGTKMLSNGGAVSMDMVDHDVTYIPINRSVLNRS